MFVRRSADKPGEETRETAASHEDRVPEVRTPQAVTGAQLYKKVKSPTKSVIDAGVTVTGTVACTAELEVMGQIQGDLHCDALIVGPSGKIIGDVFAEHAHIGGRVDGKIRGKQIILGSSAHVTGDIHHASLVIEHGAIFEGKVRRSNNPTELQPGAQAPRQVAQQTEQRPATAPHYEQQQQPNGAPDANSEIGRWPRQVIVQ